MSVYSITNRYAHALLKQAESVNHFEAVGNDLQLIHETLEGSKDLRVALESPVINKEKKKSILNELFGSKVSKDSAHFLDFVVDKNRENILFEIAERFLELRDDKMDAVPAVVTTAIELSESERSLFKKSLDSYSKKNVRITYKVDEKLIGGFVVQLKDKLLDASIHHQLQILKKRLVKSDQTLVN